MHNQQHNRGYGNRARDDEQHQAELSRALTQAQHTLTQCNLDMKEKQKEDRKQMSIMLNQMQQMQLEIQHLKAQMSGSAPSVPSPAPLSTPATTSSQSLSDSSRSSALPSRGDSISVPPAASKMEAPPRSSVTPISSVPPVSVPTRPLPTSVDYRESKREERTAGHSNITPNVLNQQVNMEAVPLYPFQSDPLPSSSDSSSQSYGVWSLPSSHSSHAHVPPRISHTSVPTSSVRSYDATPNLSYPASPTYSHDNSPTAYSGVNTPYISTPPRSATGIPPHTGSANVHYHPNATQLHQQQQQQQQQYPHQSSSSSSSANAAEVDQRLYHLLQCRLAVFNFKNQTSHCNYLYTLLRDKLQDPVHGAVTPAEIHPDSLFSYQYDTSRGGWSCCMRFRELPQIWTDYMRSKTDAREEAAKIGIDHLKHHKLYKNAFLISLPNPKAPYDAVANAFRDYCRCTHRFESTSDSNRVYKYRIYVKSDGRAPEVLVSEGTGNNELTARHAACINLINEWQRQIEEIKSMAWEQLELFEDILVKT